MVLSLWRHIAEAMTFTIPRTGQVPSAGGGASSRTTQLASSGERERVAEQASHSRRQHHLQSLVDPRTTLEEAAVALRGHTLAWN